MGRGDRPAADASLAAATEAAQHVVDILLDNVLACSKVLQEGQADQLSSGGRECIEGEGRPSESSGSDEDTESSDEDAGSSSGDT